MNLIEGGHPFNVIRNWDRQVPGWRTSLHEACQHVKAEKALLTWNSKESFRLLKSIQAGLQVETYRPETNRRLDIPEANGKMRTLQIPNIRDRVLKGH